MKKATGKTGRSGKERGAGLWAISLIISFQVLGLVLFSMATPGSVEAKTFIVTSTLDETDTNPGDGVCLSESGDCTLRAAIQEANAFAGPDVIKLKADLYMLTIPDIWDDDCATGDLDIRDDLVINGTGAKKTFIDGGKLDRVFHIIGEISTTIKNVTIQNGFAQNGQMAYPYGGDGGGIYIEAPSVVTIKGSTISNNVASGTQYAYGGGIFNLGTLTITKSSLSNSTISNNTASNDTFALPREGIQTWGGGICNWGTLTIAGGTTISNNTAHSGTDLPDVDPYYGRVYGGGIFNLGTLTITGSTISNNFAKGSRIAYGSGIYGWNGYVTITGSTISNNVALGDQYAYGGGIGNDQGTLTITGSTISNNVARGIAYGTGGGIGSFSSVTIKGSTISNNAASGIFEDGKGGGIYLENGTLTVQNASKIVRNLASDMGGGIYYNSATGDISADSKVAKNAPDDIAP